MSVSIHVTKRETRGKGGARQSRRSGLIPGIMYGAVEKPVPLAIKERDLIQFLEKEGESGLIDLIFNDEKGKKLSQEKAVIRQVDYDPAKDVPIHVDFLAVAMDRKLTISVPVELVGEPVGVVRDKGMLSQIIYELPIECLPGAIPHSIKVDVINLAIGQSFHVEDLPPLEGIKILSGKEQAIATVEAPKAEEVVVPVEAPEALAEPEVIGKKKEEGEETEEEAD